MIEMRSSTLAFSLLLLTLGAVDRRVAHGLRVQDGGALFTLGAHLLFHCRQNILRRSDVLDLIA